MSAAYVLTMIGVLTLGTQLTRWLPFLLFWSKRQQPPAFVLYLSRALPGAVIGMLVVYCLRNVSLTQYAFGIPELLGILCVLFLHLWRKNSLLSIGGGTILYMLLVQFVFV